jgi:hypothetical protein
MRDQGIERHARVLLRGCVYSTLVDLQVLGSRFLNLQPIMELRIRIASTV